MQSWHLEFLAARIPKLDMVCADAQLDSLADKTTWDRVVVLFDAKNTTALDRRFIYCERWKHFFGKRF